MEKLSTCSGCGLLQPADCFYPMTQEVCGVYIFNSPSTSCGGENDNTCILTAQTEQKPETKTQRVL